MDFSKANPQPDSSASNPLENGTPTWTYPTRMCRICREDVVPTVTLYPPGLPASFQHPIIEYKNDDEYGRLIKPCRCRGGMRYIHELCLLRCRTEGVRPGSLWKCHECGYQFNFKRLTIQRYLGSKISSGFLTVLAMIAVMFILGFIADPIINMYLDPYDTLVGNESYWQEVDVNDSGDSLSSWAQHFLKGLVSMGLVGFLKTTLLNPFQWWNLRSAAFVSGRSRGTSTTGRERAVNISWIAVFVGITSAFYFFYQWVQAIIGRTLQRIGNNIVDTQLPEDDEDLKPPPGYEPPITKPEMANGSQAQMPDIQSQNKPQNVYSSHITNQVVTEKRTEKNHVNSSENTNQEVLMKQSNSLGDTEEGQRILPKQSQQGPLPKRVHTALLWTVFTIKAGLLQAFDLIFES